MSQVGSSAKIERRVTSVGWRTFDAARSFENAIQTPRWMSLIGVDSLWLGCPKAFFLRRAATGLVIACWRRESRGLQIA